MRINRIHIAGAVVLGLAAAGGAQQPADPNPASANRTPPTVGPGVTGVQTPTTGTSTTVFVRATQVVGMEVRESTGQARIGLVADLLLTPNAQVPIASPAAARTGDGLETTPPATGSATRPGANRGIGVNGVPAYVTGPLADNNSHTWWHSDNDVRFALIQIDNATADRVIVVPWDLLQFQGAYFVLGIPESRIAEAPSVMLNDPRILQSEQWLDQIGTFFANDLQQTRGQIGVPGQPGTGAPVTPAPNSPRPANPNPQRPASRTTRQGGAARP